MNSLRFGIEIETVGLAKQAVAQAIHSVVGGTQYGTDVADRKGRTWKVVHDGSLSGFHNGEIVSPVLGYSDLEELQEVVRAVRHAGARVDASCGVHVHVSSDRLDARAVTNLVKIVAKQERLIELALGISEARLGRYCKPIDPAFVRRLEEKKPRTMDELNRAWYGFYNTSPSRYDGSRYRGLNLNSLFFRSTVEVRSFNGSLHAGEIKAYVQFVLALTARAIKAKGASSRKREVRSGGSKYQLRCFLLRLGLIGSEFKTARLHLLKRLEGDSAWSAGERPQRAQAEEVPTVASTENVAP